MNSARKPSNIALIGFMGAGKSSVGRLVAEQLGFTFLDTDELIEARVGKTITAIFEQEGEAAFRELERKVAVELEARTQTVISTGGGLPVNPDNLASLKRHAMLVYLWASPEKIWERVRDQTHRPLLKDANPLEKIRALVAAREPFYRQADVLLNTELRSPREVAMQVIHQFRSAHKNSR